MFQMWKDKIKAYYIYIVFLYILKFSLRILSIKTLYSTKIFKHDFQKQFENKNLYVYLSCCL